MKTILLCSDGSAFADGIYKYGAWFAHQFQAQMKVLFVSDIRQKVVSTGNLSGSIGLGASEQLLNELVNLEHEKAKLNKQRAKLILQNAEQVLKAEGLSNLELLNPTGFLVDCFHDFEAESDLIVLGKRGEAAEFASGHLGANVDRIVRSSAKPCLVTPQTFAPIEKLLVAYDGSPTGKRVLDFLVDSAPGFKDLEIHLLTVAKKESDAVRSQELADAEETLQQAGLTVSTTLSAGAPEKVIADYIEQHQISLLLMGAYGHRRIRHLVIGSTTVQLLRSVQVPVLLFR
ncbi:universal stress protein [Acaryochloris marina]|uniref:Universal stress protein n=1 Tax=Acaryochloris marina (strain MBIC 11017) TaxID=329726 RepID=B0C4G2_ACAM1|nr:universal stress protein [Acaryochloris marina]ABW28706.1 universal stress protein [Acaryochloris marina MBIC11017]BDM77699.1 universal stress protein [Acaryochloris marina MBIC10699]